MAVSLPVLVIDENNEDNIRGYCVLGREDSTKLNTGMGLSEEATAFNVRVASCSSESTKVDPGIVLVG